MFSNLSFFSEIKNYEGESPSVRVRVRVRDGARALRDPAGRLGLHAADQSNLPQPASLRPSKPLGSQHRALGRAGGGTGGASGRPAAARFLRRSRRGRRIRSQRRVLPRREAHPPPDLPAPPPRVLGGQALGAPLPSCRCDVAAHQPGGGRGWGQERGQGRRVVRPQLAPHGGRTGDGDGGLRRQEVPPDALAPPRHVPARSPPGPVHDAPDSLGFDAADGAAAGSGPGAGRWGSRPGDGAPARRRRGRRQR